MDEGIYHFEMQPIRRSEGRCATGAAAYRSAHKIVDGRTGEIYDYRKKRGVLATKIILPAGVPSMTSADLWNRVELHHKKSRAVTSREIEASLPHLLSEHERLQLATVFCIEFCATYRVAGQVDLHAPSKKGDGRNFHFHFMYTACTAGANGLGLKVNELDPIHCNRQKIANPAEFWRKRWADLVNERLAENGIQQRIDHRSYRERGIDREPTPHFGPAIIAMERRTGKKSNLRRAHEMKVDAKTLAIAEDILALSKAKEEFLQSQHALLQAKDALYLAQMEVARFMRDAAARGAGWEELHEDETERPS